MFAVAMVILSVPTHTITTDLQCDLIECQMWLEGTVGKFDKNIFDTIESDGMICELGMNLTNVDLQMVNLMTCFRWSWKMPLR